MKKQWTKRLGAIVLSIAMLCNSGMIFAEALDFSSEKQDAIEDKILFSTSFEENENQNLLESTTDGDHVSNVINTDYLSQGNGLAIRYETIDGSADYVGSESKYNLFDGLTGTKFLSSGSQIYVQFALEKKAVVRSYDVASANDVPGRDPSAWTLYGSNDGKTWEKVDARSNITFDTRLQTKKFGVDNSTAYEWYKFDITANKGADLTQLSELTLYTDAYEDAGEGEDNTIKVRPETIQGMEALGYDPSQDKAALFDGSTGTKFVSAVPTGFISVQLEKAIVLTTYSLGSGDDNTTHPQRSPKSWVLYGSTDGTTWVKIDERSNVTLSGNSMLTTFTVEGNKASYDWYKLDITENGGKDGTGRDIIQLSEWQFSDKAVEKDENEPTQIIVNTNKITSNHGDLTGGEGVNNIFDNSIDTKMCAVGTRPLWIQFELDAPAAINMYRIISGTRDVESARDPKAWVLYGSKDGQTWVKLDEKTDNTFDQRGTAYDFYFTNKVAYTYYKWEIIANQGVDVFGADAIQLQEFQVFTGAKKQPVVTKQEVDVSTVNSSEGTGGGEGPEKLFDGNTGSKFCKVVNSLWVLHSWRL